MYDTGGRADDATGRVLSVMPKTPEVQVKKKSGVPFKQIKEML